MLGGVYSSRGGIHPHNENWDEEDIEDKKEKNQKDKKGDTDFRTDMMMIRQREYAKEAGQLKLSW